MNVIDHYDVLGISPGSDSATIDRAYWHLARERRSLSDFDPEALDRLNRAYEILATPRLRRQFDESRSEHAEPDQERNATGAPKSARVSKLWPKAGLISLLDPCRERQHRPLEPILAPQDIHPPEVVVAEAEQLRSSTASLVERWRTSRLGKQGWTLASDR